MAAAADAAAAAVGELSLSQQSGGQRRRIGSAGAYLAGRRAGLDGLVAALGLTPAREYWTQNRVHSLLRNSIDGGATRGPVAYLEGRRAGSAALVAALGLTPACKCHSDAHSCSSASTVDMVQPHTA